MPKNKHFVFNVTIMHARICFFIRNGAAGELFPIPLSSSYLRTRQGDSYACIYK